MRTKRRHKAAAARQRVESLIGMVDSEKDTMKFKEAVEDVLAAYLQHLVAQTALSVESSGI